MNVIDYDYEFAIVIVIVPTIAITDYEYPMPDFDHIRHGGVKFHTQNELLAYFSKEVPWARRSRLRPIGYSVKQLWLN